MKIENGNKISLAAGGNMSLRVNSMIAEVTGTVFAGELQS